MVFEGTTGVYERIYGFNSKWVRKEEKYADSKWFWRIALRTDDVTKTWPPPRQRLAILQEVARALYGNAQFAISSARPFSVLRSVPVSKFEEDPGEYNVEQIKT